MVRQGLLLLEPAGNEHRLSAKLEYFLYLHLRWTCAGRHLTEMVYHHIAELEGLPCLDFLWIRAGPGLTETEDQHVALEHLPFLRLL